MPERILEELLGVLSTTVTDRSWNAVEPDSTFLAADAVNLPDPRPGSRVQYPQLTLGSRAPPSETAGYPAPVEAIRLELCLRPR